MYQHPDDISPEPPVPLTERVTRRQLVRGLWAAVAVAVIAAIPGILLDRGSNKSHVRTTSAPTTFAPSPPLSEPSVGTVTPFSEVTSTTASGAAAGVTVTTGRTSTTVRTATTTAACRNSTNPACGPFTWDPQAGQNQPLTVTVSYSFTSDGNVDFHVVVHDPDAAISKCDYQIKYGSASATGPCTPPPACPPAYGPWTPPTPAPDNFDTHFLFAPQPSGTQATFTFSSGVSCPPNPYGGTASGSVPVTSPTTTTPSS